jgi:DNA polymerase-3 subunit gamma/tau
MSSLAVKYRPQKFEDLVGHENYVTIINNMLAANQVPPAIIFAGPRGTGKTTFARLIAKAVNCESLENNEPCNKCTSCLAIENGTALDLLEMDAASNRGIDSVRQIQNEVSYCPAFKYKVILLDEAHMLTKEAFNALLKTLEEPPEHAMFMLATTNIEALPKTIQSRCQLFKLSNLAPSNVLKILARVVRAESINIERDAAVELARLTNGSARDTISMLEQLRFLKPEGITKEDVILLCDNFDIDATFDIVNALKEVDYDRMFLTIHNYFMDGGNARQLLKNVLRLLRSMLIMHSCSDPKRILNYSAKQERLFNMLANLYSESELLDMIQTVSSAFKFMEYGMDEQTLVEATLLEIMNRGRS